MIIIINDTRQNRHNTIKALAIVSSDVYVNTKFEVKEDSHLRDYPSIEVSIKKIYTSSEYQWKWNYTYNYKKSKRNWGNISFNEIRSIFDK